jgi:predicted nucleic acid-binding protein
MGQEYLIDTNIVVDYLNGNLPSKTKSFRRKLVNDIPKISVITKIEVLSFKKDEESSQMVADFVDCSITQELTKEITETAI